MKEMFKNSSIIKNFESFGENKLTQIIEIIRFDCTKNKPVKKELLTSFMPDFYLEKIDIDFKNTVDGRYFGKTKLNTFYIKFFEDKFKMQNIVKNALEEYTMSILKYSDDYNIDLLRRFLYIGEDSLRAEILELYLVLLKSNLILQYITILLNITITNSIT